MQSKTIKRLSQGVNKHHQITIIEAPQNAIKDPKETLAAFYRRVGNEITIKNGPQQ